MTVEEIREVIKAGRNDSDRLLMEVLYESGIRCDVCTRLKYEDVDMDVLDKGGYKNIAKKPKGFRKKRYENRRFWLPPHTLHKIKDHMEVMEQSETDYIFASSHQREYITSRTV